MCIWKNIRPASAKSFLLVQVVGPVADNINELFGWPSSPINQYSKTPWQTLKTLGNESVLAPGCDSNHCHNYDRQSVRNATTGADLVIVCLGTGMIFLFKVPVIFIIEMGANF